MMVIVNCLFIGRSLYQHVQYEGYGDPTLACEKTKLKVAKLLLLPLQALNDVQLHFDFLDRDNRNPRDINKGGAILTGYQCDILREDPIEGLKYDFIFNDWSTLKFFYKQDARVTPFGRDRLRKMDDLSVFYNFVSLHLSPGGTLFLQDISTTPPISEEEMANAARMTNGGETVRGECQAQSLLDGLFVKRCGITTVRTAKALLCAMDHFDRHEHKCLRFSQCNDILADESQLATDGELVGEIGIHVLDYHNGCPIHPERVDDALREHSFAKSEAVSSASNCPFPFPHPHREDDFDAYLKVVRKTC
jgi:hypothetical protein